MTQWIRINSHHPISKVKIMLKQQSYQVNTFYKKRVIRVEGIRALEYNLELILFVQDQ